MQRRFIAAVLMSPAFFGTIHGDRPHEGKQQWANASPFKWLGTTQYRNSDNVLAMAVSPSGKLLASAGGSDPTWETSIHIWNLETGALQYRFFGHKHFVTSVAFLSDDIVLSCSRSERRVRKWTLGTTESKVICKEDVWCMALAPDREELFLRTSEGEILALRTSDNTIVRRKRLQIAEFIVSKLVIAPSGKLLACNAENEEVVLLLDAKTLAITKKLTAHGDKVTSFDFSPDSRRMVTTGHEAIRLWDLETGKERHRHAFKQDPILEEPAAFSEDGKVIVAMLEHKLFALDGADLHPKKEIAVDMGRVDSLMTVPRKDLMIAAGTDQVHYFVDTKKSALVNPPVGHFSEVRCATFGPESATLWTGCRRGYVACWDTRSGKQIGKWKIHEYDAHGIAFFGEDSFLSLSTDKSLAVVRWTGKDVVIDKKRVDVAFQAIAGPLSNKRLLVASSESLFEYDWKSRKLVLRHEKIDDKEGIRLLALSPRRDQLAVGSSGEAVLIYDLAGGPAPRWRFKHGDSVFGIAYSSDGTMLASACRDGTVSLWNTTTGKVIRKYNAHKVEARSVAFFAKDRGLISGGSDSRIQFWDLGLDSDKPMRTLENSYAGRISVLSVSHDGKMLAAGEMGGLITLWDIRDTGEKIWGAGDRENRGSRRKLGDS
jgi:WD40 repeat protein